MPRATVEIVHPNLPGRVLTVPENQVAVYAKSGWVRKDAPKDKKETVNG